MKSNLDPGRRGSSQNEKKSKLKVRLYCTNLNSTDQVKHEQELTPAQLKAEKKATERLDKKAKAKEEKKKVG